MNKKPFYTFLLATAFAGTLAACNSDTGGSGEGTDGGEGRRGRRRRQCQSWNDVTTRQFIQSDFLHIYV
ncbi:hypothetical protein [Shouchella clausii]|uniref:hypothetical protein n=1 Tax=Shouchella clausii TaxID=79880 RepID=UPI00311F6546